MFNCLGRERQPLNRLTLFNINFKHMEEKKDLWQIEEKIADILGLEKEATEWRLITRDENNRKIEYTDYTDEVKEICSLIATTRLEAAREAEKKFNEIAEILQDGDIESGLTLADTYAGNI